MAKGELGGKRAGTRREFIPKSAGNVTEGLGGGKPTARKFKGSSLKTYTYVRIIGGIKYTKTFSAHSVKEANRRAEIFGFKTSDREIKRRKKKKG